MASETTIVAPATPSGEGGIGIVRISGPRAEESLARIFFPTASVEILDSHRLYHGSVHTADGSLIDEVMAVLMRAPRSYTREDVAEIHCHGGPVVLRRILDLLLDNGLHLARPGEFTLRAFLNGRLDLARAEAVIEIIRSRSDAACDVALQQLGGRLSELVHGMREDLAALLAEVETHVDFAEEDIEHADQQRLLSACDLVASRIAATLATFDSGRTLRDGLAVLILGRPNAGKSSLMNLLLGESRAIVTEVAGTTRDTIEEHLLLGDLPVRLVDTAGVRDTDDPVEAEGVRRAREKVAGADLVLLVVDGSRPLDDEDFLALELCRGKRILLVVNKSDLPTQPLPSPFTDLPRAPVSAHTGEGLDGLRAAIAAPFAVAGRGEGRESILLSDRRHREAMLRADSALQRFCEGVVGEISPEFLALELREALQALGEITGETTPEEVLNRIFDSFCIGK